MKLILLTVSMLSFTACSTDLDHARQEAACEKHGGLHRFESHIMSAIYCKDGTRISNDDWRYTTGPDVLKYYEKGFTNE